MILSDCSGFFHLKVEYQQNIHTKIKILRTKQQLIDYTKWLNANSKVIINPDVIDEYINSLQTDQPSNNHPKVESEYITTFKFETFVDLVNKGLMTNDDNHSIFKGFNIFIDPKPLH